MKKFFLIISILLVIAILSSCQTNDSNVSNNTVQTDAPKNPVNYVMYADFATGAGENASIDAARPDIELKPSAEKNFNISDREPIEEPLKSTTEIKRFEILEKTYEVTYASSYSSVVSLETNRTINQYTADGLIVDFVEETNEILIFMDSSVDKNAEGTLSKEQAIEKAKKIIENIYGIDTSKNYTIDASLEESPQKKIYHISGRRYVHGFKTCDEIIINLNMNGELASIGATKNGTMSTAEQDITKEEIENAINAVKEKFSASWTVSDDHWIVTDYTGAYYLRTIIARSLDKSPPAMEIHTNIQ